MDCGSRSGGGRRLKDRLAQLLRPAANSLLLRSPCSSSSTSATAFTATAAATAATATISTSSTSTTAANYTTAVTGALQLIPRAEPFSAALDRLRHPPPPPPERIRSRSNRHGSSSSRHGSRRRCRSTKNAAIDKGGGGVVMALSSNPYGFTSSGEEEDDDDNDTDADGCYGEADTEAFLSSSRRSLLVSSDSSSGFYTSRRINPPPPPADKSHRRERRRRRRRRCRRPSASCVAEACGAGAVREPGFRPLVAAAAEQVRRGLAVVKRSRDPYGDFRESMVEMIVGRQVFGAAELERLLASYLSLNAPRFHPIILQAFSDIWLVLHGG
ncbi:unnamed protein product [Urochloa humidicola]